jgi:hypothetical protein
VVYFPKFHPEAILNTIAAWRDAGALALGMVVGGMTVHVSTGQASAVQNRGSAAPELETTLYFGDAHSKGSLSGYFTFAALQ